MKLTWKNQNKKHKRPLLSISTLPFDQNDDRIISNNHNIEQAQAHHHNDTELAEAFHAQGTKLAEDRRYHEALGKWEAAITLMPERAVLHQQKAQVLLEIGEAWNALKAATRATELEPSWAEWALKIENFKEMANGDEIGLIEAVKNQPVGATLYITHELLEYKEV
ncbi:hypothetical protein CsSME_00016961 [Camellia sinensis var. sinensis]